MTTGGFIQEPKIELKKLKKLELKKGRKKLIFPKKQI
jgi:hypothetical protein